MKSAIKSHINKSFWVTFQYKAPCTIILEKYVPLFAHYTWGYWETLNQSLGLKVCNYSIIAISSVLVPIICEIWVRNILLNSGHQVLRGKRKRVFSLHNELYCYLVDKIIYIWFFLNHIFKRLSCRNLLHMKTCSLSYVHFKNFYGTSKLRFVWDFSLWLPWE